MIRRGQGLDERAQEQVGQHERRCDVGRERRLDFGGVETSDEPHRRGDGGVVDQRHRRRLLRGELAEDRQHRGGRQSGMREVAGDVPEPRAPMSRTGRPADADDREPAREQLGGERLAEAARDTGDDCRVHRSSVAISTCRHEVSTPPRGLGGRG